VPSGPAAVDNVDVRLADAATRWLSALDIRGDAAVAELHGIGSARWRIVANGTPRQPPVLPVLGLMDADLIILPANQASWDDLERQTA
jgi:hypothetical protein